MIETFCIDYGCQNPLERFDIQRKNQYSSVSVDIVCKSDFAQDKYVPLEKLKSRPLSHSLPLCVTPASCICVSLYATRNLFEMVFFSLFHFPVWQIMAVNKIRPEFRLISVEFNYF